MTTRHAIVIAVDGLRAAALGAYGNSWGATPALDRLASESLLFDWMFVDSPDADGFYRAAWLGASVPMNGVESDPLQSPTRTSLPQQLAAAGIATQLTTDDARLAEQGERLGFADVRYVEFGPPTEAETVADAELAKLMAVAADQVEAWAAPEDAAPPSDSAGRLLWVHARGYRGAWDAPLALRQSLLEEGDPPPLESLVPPAQIETVDPDELLLHRASYAAQTLLLDECLDMLLATIDAAGMTESTLVVLVGCRGFALGEHGKVGSEVHDLYGELLHVPLLIREPRLEVAPPRSAEFVQPVDLHATLASWFGDQSSRGEAGRDLLARPTASPPDGRPYVTAFAQSGEATLRSKEWLFRVSAQSGGIGTLPRRMELYAKPDDRWEANEVADLCPEPAAEMLRAIEALPGSAS